MPSELSELAELLSPHESCPDCGTSYTDTTPQAFRDVTFVQLEEGCDHCTPYKTAISMALHFLRKGSPS